MPDFSRDDRMPPISQSSISSASHTTAPRERRYSGPSDSGGKPARYPGVYQRPPPSDYYRGPSPPPQPYRWPPAPPLDEPAYPSRSSHSSYHRDPWDYRYRDSNVGMSAQYPPNRSPPPFPEWGHMVNPERGWSPGFGPEDSRYARRDWEDRENSQHYSHGWDRPPSPGPLPPRDWQPGPYDRPSGGQPRGSPSLLHEPGWSREPVSHYERDLREDWMPPPDDWSRDRDDHYIPDDPYLNDPPPPGIPYGPPRARGRSFVQERRMPQPPPSGYSHPPASQLSPRGPSHMPLDNPSRRHPQHDRRYNSGPGYSGDGRGYVPHGPRRPFQSGRGSYNEPGHLPSRGAKIMPRDQLLVANTSIKVEDNDGQSSLTPAPVSASSTSPDKSSFTGKRSRTDSVAAEAEPSSRRPSPFTSSAATTVAAPVDSAPVPAPAPAPVPALVQPTPIEPQPQTSATSSEDLKPSTVESPVNIPAEAEPKAPVEVQEQRVYAESNDASESVPAVTEAPTVSARPDISATLASEAVVEEAPSVSPDNTQTATDDATSMEVEPSASQPGPVQPQPDVITADSVPASSTAALDATHSDLPAVDATEFVSEEPETEPEQEQEQEPPASHFKFIDLYDEEQEEVPPLSVQDAILLRQPNLQELELNAEAVIQENLKIASQNKPIVSSDDDEVALEIFTMPHKVWRSLYRGTLLSASQARDNWILSKASCLEYDYMNYHEEWMKHCARLDYLAEQRRVRGAQAAAAAAQNVVSEPVAAQTRSTRRNPVVNTGVMADAVHSDMEMEKVMNNMRDAAAVDPDLLARPNLAKIPDMVTISGPEMVRLTFNDENGQVDNPLDFYDFRGRAAEQWTIEERNIFIEQHRIYNKRFEKIAEHLPHKTTSQCVQYYYLMKKVPSFRAQVKRGQRRRLGRGGHQGKASALMADIEKEEDGTTASPREDESIATRRSRRHVATVAAAALAGTPPPSASTATEGTKPRRSRVAELARANSFGTDRDGTATPTSFASDSETGGDPLNPTDLDSLLSNQPLRKGGPGRGRRWAHKGEVPNGNGGSVRLDGAAPSKKRPATTSYWTVAERTTLKQNLLRHGRDWNRIAAVLQTKTAIQAKNYYSNNQKEMSVFVRAWEREQAKANGESASALASEIKPESSANASPAPASKDARKTGTPVTIQPAPGQNTTTPPTNGTASPGKSTSGRGSSHYPNVIPQSQTSQPAPQKPQWSRNTFSATKPKSQGSANQPQVIPTPPLPLPGPTFRAWPVTATPPPPPMSFAFGTFSGVAGPSVPKGNGSTQVVAPSVQRTGSASASASATPSPVANSSPASNSNRTSGVQRTNVNHYPGPMRYQPYPIAATSPGSGNKSKPILLQRSSASTLVTVAPTPGTVPAQAAAASGAPGPKTQLPRNSSGQFAPWGGEKGKK